MRKPTNYRCSENTLYQVAQMTIKNLKKDLATFSKFSPFYNADMVAELEADLKTAKRLPSKKARTKNQLLTRETLLQAAETSKAQWLALKAYINRYYSGEQQTIMLNAIGNAYSTEANRSDWENLANMLASAQLFLEEHAADLVTAKIMPDTFVTTFNDSTESFENTRQEYFDELDGVKQKTVLNKNANLSLYQKLSIIYHEGKLIFKNSEEKRNLYTFDYLLRLVEGAPKTAPKKEEVTTPKGKNKSKKSKVRALENAMVN